ncbi:hypothetical protein ACSYEE_20110, partial [Bacillus velezensis]
QQQGEGGEGEGGAEEEEEEVPWAFCVATTTSSSSSSSSGKPQDDDDQEEEARKVIKYLNSKVTKYKHLKGVTWIEELPKNAAGKVLKRQLREGAGRSKK